LNQLAILAFTHKNMDLSHLGKFHIADEHLQEKISCVKELADVNEVLYLSTCNRVEFLLARETSIDQLFLSRFFKALYPQWADAEIKWAASHVAVYESDEALKHFFSVASSVDSLVVGEREIITQVRNAYEKCNSLGFTGDLIRLVVKRTIETAKKVYTETQIANRPVSVVSLAYRKLKELNVKPSARFLIIGSGQTNTQMSKFLKKHGFNNFVVFNRTLSNAQKLAEDLKCNYFELSALKEYKQGFDVILTCTGAEEAVVTKELYAHLLQGETTKKVVIDLAVPNDLDQDVVGNFDLHLINIQSLQAIADENLKERKKELDACHAIINESMTEFKEVIKTRKVELAMSEVPKKVKEIRQIAFNSVFAKEIDQLDVQSKEVLDKIVDYFEKKYISVPMKMAKEIMIKKEVSKG
jgi:glutamyl-tRNA reductase